MRALTLMGAWVALLVVPGAVPEPEPARGACDVKTTEPAWYCPMEKRKIPVGILDINLYRDDLSTVDIKPVVSATEINFPVAGKDIILMDDVLYTGRTIRAALDALFDHGRPARVQLLVLIDRGHRELPIEAKYVGRMVQTTANEIIEVKFREVDNMEKVLLVEKA